MLYIQFQIGYKAFNRFFYKLTKIKCAAPVRPGPWFPISISHLLTFCGKKNARNLRHITTTIVPKINFNYKLLSTQTYEY